MCLKREKIIILTENAKDKHYFNGLIYYKTEVGI